ncbi:MAG: DUF6783 domain-containing protein [Lachnospiraceae bacterium]
MSANWDSQLTKSLFQTRSRSVTVQCLHSHVYYTIHL